MTNNAVVANQGASRGRHDVDLFIGGRFEGNRERLQVVNPSTEEVIGTVACATEPDLDDALAAAEAGFRAWRRQSAMVRGQVLSKAAALIRERADGIARIMTREQGKPLAQAHLEVMLCAETFD